MLRGNGSAVKWAAALACVFGAVLAVAAGAEGYRRVGNPTVHSSEEGIGLTFIARKIPSADEAGKAREVHMGTFGGGDAVFLLDEADGVSRETILYVYDGTLRELNCERGKEPEPEAGKIIAEARELSGWEMTPGTPGLLRLQYTDADGGAETMSVSLQSGQTEQEAEAADSPLEVDSAEAVNSAEAVDSSEALDSTETAEIGEETVLIGKEDKKTGTISVSQSFSVQGTMIVPAQP